MREILFDLSTPRENGEHNSDLNGWFWQDWLVSIAAPALATASVSLIRQRRHAQGEACDCPSAAQLRPNTEEHSLLPA